MENASKALIIAGAILLAILLISLGILIFSQAQDVVQNSGMTQAEITAFNSKWSKYEGDQKGSVVKAMMQEVLASNADSNNSNKQITVKKGESDVSSSSDFLSSKQYTVSITSYTNGCVSVITVTEKTK